jgi:hypothetical protein
MPVDITFKPAGAAYKCWGTVTDQEYLQAENEMYTHSYPNDLQYVITDFTDTKSFQITSSAIQTMAKQDMCYRESHDPFAIAIIAPTACIFGMARMWQLLSGLEESGAVIVKSMDEAKAWLTRKGIEVE